MTWTAGVDSFDYERAGYPSAKACEPAKPARVDTTKNGRVVKSVRPSPRAALSLSGKSQMTRTDSSAGRRLSRRWRKARTVGVEP
jgi:hypothetical protein